MGAQLCLEDDMNADWIKWRWNLPPYKSAEFMEHLKLLGMTLDDFRKLPKYQFAVEQGLIVNDEWVGEKPMAPPK